MQRPAFDLDDTTVPARLEDLAVETRWPEEATDDLLVEFESIRDNQGKTSKIHPPRKVAKQSVSVPVASPSRHRRWPEPRPDLDRNEDPTRCLLVARERANLVGLKLFGSEAGDPSVIESTTHLGCLLEPAGDGVPGNPFDPGNRGNADTLDSESDDPIESSSSMLETVVGRAFRRGERLSALAAPRLVKILERPAGQQFARLPSPREESSRQGESAAVPSQQPVTSVRAQGALPSCAKIRPF